MKRLPPRSSLFPYTTLFRSNEIRVSKSIAPAPAPTAYAVGYFLSPLRGFYSARRSAGLIRRWPSHTATTSRSEERRVGKSVDLGGRRITKKKESERATVRVV